MPPEWFPTTSAPPGGKESRPRTCDRKYVFKNGRIALIRRRVVPGSNLPMSALSALSVSLTFLLDAPSAALRSLDGIEPPADMALRGSGGYCYATPTPKRPVERTDGL